MDLATKSDTEILSVADPIMDNLMDASTAVDYDRHIRDFTDRLKGRLSKEQLEWICQDYQNAKGYFAGREFVAAFRRPDSVAVVWKQRFSKQPGEFVAEMVLVQQNGRYLVDHVMVF
ncbi:hypothetical protein [Stenotrophomonas acidaminiphila]|uniref:hypothetical protein n=1 Tax=Stenotrophomonas acidaminiphila TaxID=128780 RepID=UPI0020C62867|nr:hypothetical protein [Stenotrophomonas acidaminiphila]